MIPKFRAWIKSLEVMADVLAIRFEDKEVLLKGYKRNSVADFDQVEFMQSTDLKDKNGVEIYEGDIIKLIGTYKDSKGKELGRYKVKWNDYYTGFYPLIDDHLRGNIEWEVIGNIYENPKLLKEQNK